MTNTTVEGKVCTGCGTWQPAEEFLRWPSGTLRWRCTKCRKQYDARLRERDGRTARERNLISRYKITESDFQLLIAAQGGKCAIEGCSGKPTDVDHDHACCPGKRTCGKCIRGILCNSCNRYLGRIEAVLLEADSVKPMLNYLRSYR